MELPRESLEPIERLAMWGIAAFETAIFTLVLILLLYGDGSLGPDLASLSTALGFAVYLTLWACTIYTTMRVMRTLPLRYLGVHPLDPALIANATHWGGMNAIFFVCLIAGIAAVTIAVYGILIGDSKVGFGIPMFAIFVGTVGSFFGYIIGAIVGSIFGVGGGLLLYISRRQARAG